MKFLKIRNKRDYMCKAIQIVLLGAIYFLLTNPLYAQVGEVDDSRAHQLDEAFNAILLKYDVNTIGAAVIKSGEVDWLHHYGQQSANTPATEETLFNVGSITKTITAQTILKLADANKLSLDEAMSDYWVDPDLAEDAKHKMLTPRMALTHTTGFPNWRFFSQDRTLKFLSEPGAQYRYSGEGFEYLAKFAENKLDTPFEELAKKYVFEPAGLRNISINVDQNNFPQIAQSLDKDGNFPGYYCSPQGWCSEPGDVSVAGDMVVTVKDYAAFLIWVMNGSGMAKNLNEQIQNIAIEQPIVNGFDCTKEPLADCTSNQGYGLGWNVSEYDGGRVIGHGGSDWSLVTLAYYYPDTKDAVIIFINGLNENAFKAMLASLKLLDPTSTKIHEYRFRVDRNAR